jgi:hypothetical protein
VVGFDSIIPPGREGKITQKIDLKNAHSGEMIKAVTVTSNAKNQPSMRLTIKVVIKAIINVNTSYVQLSKAQSTAEVILSTEKKDLQVKKVYFKMSNPGGGMPGSQASWQGDLPLFINFTMQKPDSVKADGYMDYKLKLTSTLEITEPKEGEFIIETNHPEKTQISIRGRLDK